MAFHPFSLLLLLLSSRTGRVNAQVFPSLLLAVDYPGISDACELALNTTLFNCPSLLGSVSVDNPRLSSDQLQQLCTSNCQTELASVRKIIENGCNQATDVISYDDVDWPATLIIDRFIYTYDLSCQKDPASGQFCDDIFTSWLNQSTLTAAQNCSDCMLGATTAVPKPTNAPDESNSQFARWYVIQEGNYCSSISITQGITISDFYFPNPQINSGCTNLVLGFAYCVPAVGSISTYSGYLTTTHIFALTSMTFTTTKSTLVTVAPSITPIIALPTAPGTIENCEAYVEYVEVSGLADQAQAVDYPVLTNNINNCNYVISMCP